MEIHSGFGIELLRSRRGMAWESGYPMNPDEADVVRWCREIINDPLSTPKAVAFAEAGIDKIAGWQ